MRVFTRCYHCCYYFNNFQYDIFRYCLFYLIMVHSLYAICIIVLSSKPSWACTYTRPDIYSLIVIYNLFIRNVQRQCDIVLLFCVKNWTVWTHLNSCIPINKLLCRNYSSLKCQYVYILTLKLIL